MNGAIVIPFGILAVLTFGAQAYLFRKDKSRTGIARRLIVPAVIAGVCVPGAFLFSFYQWIYLSGFEFSSVIEFTLKWCIVCGAIALVAYLGPVFVGFSVGQILWNNIMNDDVRVFFATSALLEAAFGPGAGAWHVLANIVMGVYCLATSVWEFYLNDW
jgi:hypothetical protein